MNKKIFGVLILNIIYLFFIKPSAVLSQPNYLKPQSAGTTIKATVAPTGFLFSLFGYSSPYSLIIFEGRDFYYQTQSDKEGYFIFHDRPVGQPPLEGCLTAQDQLGRLSKPVCLPPLPLDYDYNMEIGPVILPPTLSLNQPTPEIAYFINSEVILTGQTIPNTNVNLSLFTEEKNNLLGQNFGGWIINGLIKPVEAFGFPAIEIKADSGGNFSVRLPSSLNALYRLFAQTSFRGFRSPESFVLELNIWPIWIIIINKLLALKLPILVVLFVFFLYLFRQYFHPHNLTKKRAIVVRRHYDLYLPENKIVIKD